MHVVQSKIMFISLKNTWISDVGKYCSVKGFPCSRWRRQVLPTFLSPLTTSFTINRPFLKKVNSCNLLFKKYHGAMRLGNEKMVQSTQTYRCLHAKHLLCIWHSLSLGGLKVWNPFSPDHIIKMKYSFTPILSSN